MDQLNIKNKSIKSKRRKHLC